MRSILCFQTLALPAVFVMTLCGCERTKKTETADRETVRRDTVTVIQPSQTKTQTEKEVREFKNWVNEKTSQDDSIAREKWPKIREGFKTQTNRLEKNLDSLSTDARRDYEGAKAKYQAWENRRDTRTAQPLDNAKLNTWRKELLGERRDFSTITGANAKETYLLFMGILRAKKDNWSASDWDYVDQVYSEMNTRKREIESKIPAGDRVKIKALQTEYLAFEAAADAKDAYGNAKQ